MDKAPSFGLPFFYRVVLPGTVTALLLAPLIARYLEAVGRNGQDLPVVIAFASVFLGFTLASLDYPIYLFFEGSRGWPHPLRGWMTRRLAREVKALVEKVSKEDDPTYAADWGRLRRFPFDEKWTPV